VTASQASTKSHGNVKDAEPDICHHGATGVPLMGNSIMLTDLTLSVFKFQHVTNTTNIQEMKLTATHADHAQMDQDGLSELTDLVVKELDNHATASQASTKSLGNVKDVALDTCHHATAGVMLLEHSTMALTVSTQYVLQFHHAINTTNIQEMKLTATNAELAQMDQDGLLEVTDLDVKESDNHATVSQASTKLLGNVKDAELVTCHHGATGVSTKDNSEMLTDSTQYVFKFQHVINITNIQEMRLTATHADHAQMDQDGL
jgi:hypothetical protein